MEHNNSIIDYYDFSLLPPHIITQILDNLRFRQILTASQTCKSWYFASCDPKITKRVRVRIRNNYDRLDQLTRPFSTLVLSDANFNEFNYKEFFTIFGHCIIEIEFINCTLSAKHLLDCLIVMTNLSILKIVPRWETFADAVNLTGSDTEAIKPILGQLKHFSVLQLDSNCDGLQFIMNMMVNLKTLCFGRCTEHTQEPFKNLVSFANLSNLEELVVENLSQNTATNFIRDFSQVTATLNLKSFALTTAYSEILRIRYYDHNFVLFCQKLENLRKLSLHSVGENHLNAISAHMPQLTELTLFGVTTHKVKIIGSLRNLEKLSLTHFNQTVEDDQAEMFSTLTNLKHLALDYPISDEVLHSICTNCKHLTWLDLTRLRTINLDVLYKNLVQLKYLNLMIGGRYDQVDVTHNITSLKLLEHFNINILVPGMTMELIEKLPNLRSTSLQELKITLATKITRPPMQLGVRAAHIISRD